MGDLKGERFMKIILASASPRRRELMNIICSDFTVRPVDADERIPEEISAENAAVYLAGVKARAAKLSGDEIIIGCDTVVTIGQDVLGKPKDREECREMLERLSGNTHKVYTGVCIRSKDGIRSFSEMTEVTFYEISDEEITAYMDTGEPFDKAGGYGIQGKGAVFVKKIIGDYFNVVGLPVARLYHELREMTVIRKDKL